MTDHTISTKTTPILFIMLFTACCLSYPIYALTPEQVLVVYNTNSPDSAELAEYYQSRRGIPDSNMCPITCPTQEIIYRDEYDQSIKEPVKKYLLTNKLDKKILCIALMYGVPLKMIPTSTKSVNKEIQDIRRQIRKKEESGATEPEIAPLKEQQALLQQTFKTLNNVPTKAAVDSELTLVLRDEYNLTDQVANPYYYFPDKEYRPFDGSFNMYMTARLDAPEPSIVRAMIDRAIEAERIGLHGTAYFDLRGVQSGPYQQMDNYLLMAADLTERYGIKTITEKTNELFGANACPDTAFYWGWYSVSNYRDSFTFAPGAIAVHIASGECITLHGASNIWCPQLLRHGATVTLGPTAEPYLSSFPNPVVFLSALFEGYTVTEAYFISSPYLSWKMVLLADPLYTPYKNKLQLPSNADRD